MIRTWLIWVGSMFIVAVVAHAAFIFAYPSIIMSTAMARFAGQGENVWRQLPRITEASRGVVRPSPDLAYAVCVYSLANGPVRIAIAPWGEYMSLSLFADNTDNFYTLNDRQMPEGGAIVIIHQASQGLSAADRTSAFATVQSPSARGLALIRRLAPTSERFNEAVAAGASERCEALS